MVALGLVCLEGFGLASAQVTNLSVRSNGDALIEQDTAKAGDCVRQDVNFESDIGILDSFEPVDAEECQLACYVRKDCYAWRVSELSLIRGAQCELVDSSVELVNSEASNELLSSVGGSVICSGSGEVSNLCGERLQRPCTIAERFSNGRDRMERSELPRGLDASGCLTPSARWSLVEDVDLGFVVSGIDDCHVRCRERDECVAFSVQSLESWFLGSPALCQLHSSVGEPMLTTGEGDYIGTTSCSPSPSVADLAPFSRAFDTLIGPILEESTTLSAVEVEAVECARQRGRFLLPAQMFSEKGRSPKHMRGALEQFVNVPRITANLEELPASILSLMGKDLRGLSLEVRTAVELVFDVIAAEAVSKAMESLLVQGGDVKYLATVRELGVSTVRGAFIDLSEKLSIVDVLYPGKGEGLIGDLKLLSLVVDGAIEGWTFMEGGRKKEVVAGLTGPRRLEEEKTIAPDTSWSEYLALFRDAFATMLHGVDSITSDCEDFKSKICSTKVSKMTKKLKALIQKQEELVVAEKYPQSPYYNARVPLYIDEITGYRKELESAINGLKEGILKDLDNLKVIEKHIKGLSSASDALAKLRASVNDVDLDKYFDAIDALIKRYGSMEIEKVVVSLSDSIASIDSLSKRIKLIDDRSVPKNITGDLKKLKSAVGKIWEEIGGCDEVEKSIGCDDIEMSIEMSLEEAAAQFRGVSPWDEKKFKVAIFEINRQFRDLIGAEGCGSTPSYVDEKSFKLAQVESRFKVFQGQGECLLSYMDASIEGYGEAQDQLGNTNTIDQEGERGELQEEVSEGLYVQGYRYGFSTYREYRHEDSCPFRYVDGFALGFSKGLKVPPKLKDRRRLQQTGGLWTKSQVEHLWKPISMELRCLGAEEADAGSLDKCGVLCRDGVGILDFEVYFKFLVGRSQSRIIPAIVVGLCEKPDVDLTVGEPSG